MDSNESKLLEKGTKKGFEVLSEVNIAHIILLKQMQILLLI